MALGLLISWRCITLWFISGIKFRTKVFHLLTHRFPPQCIPIFTIEINFLLHILRDLYPKLVSLQPILEFRFFNYLVPVFQSMRHSPSEDGLH